MNLQQEVINWWHTGRNYQQGIMLFARISKNKVLIHFFMKKHEKYGRSKLEYELPKAVGLDRKKMPGVKEPIINSQFPNKTPISKSKNQQTKKEELPKPENRKSEPETLNLKPETKNTEQDRSKEYPKVIRRLKYEYSDLYNQRSVLHKRMRSVPETNPPENMNKRALLFVDIEKLTDRMEFLYSFIETWEKTGIEPIEEEIWPVKKEDELPDNLDELKKIKKNLQSSNTKDRNLLQFQQKSKAAKNNPMPAGPKRKRVEFRIKKREEEIERIEQKLVELENAG